MAARSSEERLIVFVLVGLALAAGAFLWWQGRGPGAPAEWQAAADDEAGAGDGANGEAALAGIGGEAGATGADAAGAAAGQFPTGAVVVHVAGAVLHPGVYTLPGGSRVVDAVTAAGGATTAADPDAVNLAQPLTDGERLYIPTHKETSAQPTGAAWDGGSTAAGATGGTWASGAGSGTAGSGGTGPVNLNTATETQLDTLPGIGPTLAARIVAFRTLNGPFRSPEELMNVSGIGPKKYADLEAWVTVR